MSILEDLMAVGGFSGRQLQEETGLKDFKDIDILPEEDFDKLSRAIASRIQIAYVAGLFDRHSSWSILKLMPNREKNQGTTSTGRNRGPINLPSYSIRIRFMTKHKLLAEVLEKVLGEGFTTYHKSSKAYCLFLTSRKARRVIDKLLPYLVLKRQEALLLQEASSILESNPGMGKAVIAQNVEYSGRAQVYPSVKAASEALHMGKNGSMLISGVLGGKAKTSHGYHFYYAANLYKDLSYLDKLDEICLKLKKLKESR